MLFLSSLMKCALILTLWNNNLAKIYNRIFLFQQLLKLLVIQVSDHQNVLNSTFFTHDPIVQKHAVGTFNDSSATQYCMNVSDIEVDGLASNNASKKAKA